MPYIPSKRRRNQIDKIVKKAIAIDIKPDGELNYFLFRLFIESVTESYNNDKNYIAELTECAAEIRRRYLSSYEDIKIKTNGDVEKWRPRDKKSQNK
jgi:hypothetical protein